MTLDELQARRAARKAQALAARDEQYAKDLEALNALEEEHGDGRVTALDLPAYVPGLPTMVVVKTPAAQYFKRFRDMARRKNAEPGQALDLLASSCVAYPDEETYKKICEQVPGTHDCVGAAAIKLAEAKDADAGKN